MSFEIVLLPSLTIMGAELRTTYKNNECYTAIPAFWMYHKQTGDIFTIPHKVDQSALIALYTNYTPYFSLSSGQYSMIISSPVTHVDTVLPNMVIKELPASRYAIFTAHNQDEVAKTWMNIWQSRELKRTFTGDFDWYDSTTPIVKIYVAIQ